MSHLTRFPRFWSLIAIFSCVFPSGLAWAQMDAPVADAPVADAPAASAPVAGENEEAGIKPVAVLSIAPYTELSQDVMYFFKAAGMEGLGMMANAMAMKYVEGFDTSRPAGAVVLLEKLDDPKVIVFVPVKDVEKYAKNFADQIGEPLDLGGGLYEIDAETPFFVKQKGDWSFICATEKEAKNLPEFDPSEIVKGMNEEFDISLQVRSNNIPPDMLELAVTQLREVGQRWSDQVLEEEDEVDKELVEQLRAQFFTNAASFIEHLDQLTFGLSIDRLQQHTQLEFRITADDRTDLLKRLSAFSTGDSAFGGFRLKDATANVNIHGALTEDDAQLLLKDLGLLRERAMAGLKEDQRIPSEEVRQKVADRLGAIIDQWAATIKGKRIDGGAVAILAPGALNVVVGGQVADGAAMEKAVLDLIEVLKLDPEFPEFRQSGEHQSVRLHSASVPIPRDDEDARDLLGDTLDLTLGFGPKSAYLAFGKSSQETLKRVIDGSAEAQEMLPVKASVALGPIISFIAEQNEDPLLAVMASNLKDTGGLDHLQISVEPVERGLAYRLKLEDGVIQMLGQLSGLFFTPDGL